MSRAPDKPLKKANRPVVTFREEEAGRETLAAIAEDARAALLTGVRGPAPTKHYGDRISNAPGAVSPKTARALDTSPEVLVTLTTPGRETYAIIDEEYRGEAPDIEIITDEDDDFSDDDWLDSLDIERVYTFVVSASMEQFRSSEQRFRLVERRLLTHLPGCTIDQVTRIELSAGVQLEGIIVKVWTRIID